MFHMSTDRIEENDKSLLDKFSTEIHDDISDQIVKPIDEKLHKKMNIVLLDKVTFVVGVALVILSEYIFLCRPNFMPIFYLFIVGPLVLTRFIIYKKIKWHYFMIDFCYFTNIWLIITVILCFLFRIYNPLVPVLFQLTQGPLLMAIPVWTNSLVFHDLSKITSISIHFIPAMVTFCLRWCFDFELPDEVGVIQGFVIPLCFYCFWQMLYLVITEILKHKTIYNEGYMTSYRFLIEFKRHGWFKLMNETFHLHVSDGVLFIGSQFYYTAGSLVIATFCYKYKAFNIVFIIFCFLFAVWNGAGYYFNIFLKRYNKYLERVESQYQLKKKRKEAMKDPSKHKDGNEEEILDYIPDSYYDGQNTNQNNTNNQNNNSDSNTNNTEKKEN